jgi:hypothetical protein
VVVPGEMTRFSTVKAQSFGSGLSVFVLWLSGHCVGVDIVPLVLSPIVRSPSAGYIHRDLHVVVCWAWGVSGVV